MTPYQRLQLGYLLASGVLAALAWIGLGRRPRLAARPLARLLATGLALALPLSLGALATKVFDHSHSTYQFAFIALGYYAAALWLPLLVLGDAASRARRGGPRDVPAALLALALALGGAYALFVEPNRLVTTEHSVSIAAWDEDVPALRVVHVSDLQSVGACARERRAARIIQSLEPDLVVVTGDYAAGPFGDPEPAVAAARAFLSALHATYGVVVVPGHSESESLRRRIFEGLDVLYLNDEERVLELDVDGHERSLRLLGVSAERPRFEDFARDVLPGRATVAVSHVPDVSARFDGLGVDLHLAGHTHGGQVAFPLVGPPLTLSGLPRSMARGLHTLGDHPLHVSAGLGMEGNHAPRVRFLCPPSIDLLVLSGSGQTGSSRSRP